MYAATWSFQVEREEQICLHEVVLALNSWATNIIMKQTGKTALFRFELN